MPTPCSSRRSGSTDASAVATQEGITITLANPTQIIGSDDAAMDAERAYTITDQHFSMDVVSISDGIYDAMMDQMLASPRRRGRSSRRRVARRTRPS